MVVGVVMVGMEATVDIVLEVIMDMDLEDIIGVVLDIIIIVEVEEEVQGK